MGHGRDGALRVVRPVRAADLDEPARLRCPERPAGVSLGLLGLPPGTTARTGQLGSPRDGSVPTSVDRDRVGSVPSGNLLRQRSPREPTSFRHRSYRPPLGLSSKITFTSETIADAAPSGVSGLGSGTDLGESSHQPTRPDRPGYVAGLRHHRHRPPLTEATPSRWCGAPPGAPPARKDEGETVLQGRFRLVRRTLEQELRSVRRTCDAQTAG